MYMNADLITARSSLYKHVCIIACVTSMVDIHISAAPACIRCHMFVMQEAFHSLLTPEQQKVQLAKSRKMTKKMEVLAAEIDAATNPGATPGTAADQPSGHDEGLPFPASPPQGVDGADVPSPAVEGFLGRRARVGAENNKMFPSDGMFRRVRRLFRSLPSCISDVCVFPAVHHRRLVSIWA
jgi:hypothetical protein